MDGFVEGIMLAGGGEEEGKKEECSQTDSPSVSEDEVSTADTMKTKL